MVQGREWWRGRHLRFGGDEVIMRIFAQDVRVVGAAVSVGGTESEIIHMESAESPVVGASDCIRGGGVRSSVVSAELFGDSVGAATVVACTMRETTVTCVYGDIPLQRRCKACIW